MLFIKKTLEDLMNESIVRMEQTVLPDGRHLAVTPGSIARLFLAIVNQELADYYTKLESVHIQSFLSTSTGEYVDLIGALVQCTRDTNETDELYKARIQMQTTRLERANELAVRMALLTIEDVQDVLLKPFTHGSGSFTAFIITSEREASATILQQCNAALLDVVAYGVKYFIQNPTLVPVTLGVKLILKKDVVLTPGLSEQVREAVKGYINSRPIGGDLIYNELIEQIMSVSNDIYDISLFRYTVRENEVRHVNQTCAYYERFIEASVPDAILIV